MIYIHDYGSDYHDACSFYTGCFLCFSFLSSLTLEKKKVLLKYFVSDLRSYQLSDHHRHMRNMFCSDYSKTFSSDSYVAVI